jgi:hypothetical protein
MLVLSYLIDAYEDPFSNLHSLSKVH